MTVQHEAAADEGIDEDVQEAAHARAVSLHQLGKTSSRGVLDELDSKLGATTQRGHALSQIDSLPGVRKLWLNSENVLPSFEGQWGGETNAANSPALFAVQRSAQASHQRVDVIEDLARIRKCVF